MCGMSNSNIVPRIEYANNGDGELLVAKNSISSKSSMTMSTLFMKLNLYGLVIAWIQMAHKKMHLGVLMCVRVNDGDLETITVLIS